MSAVYPISEIFHSVQGEGAWVGTPMMFVRLAGCNVGKYDSGPINVALKSPDFEMFKAKTHSVCTSFTGESFLCDTDYHQSYRSSAEDIAAELDTEEHVCITGGEPFLHDLRPLMNAFWALPAKPRIHIETSGTKPYEMPFPKKGEWWITCCPKEGLLLDQMLLPHEWKVLVGADFNQERLEEFLHLLDERAGRRPVFLQPINGVEEVNRANLARCLELLKSYPNFKLSAQCHKLWGVR